MVSYPDFQLAQVFNESPTSLLSLSFSSSGDTLVASNGESLNVYDCLGGTLLGSVKTNHYGCQLVKFWRNSGERVLHSSTKEDHSVRLLSLNEQQYERFFFGHTQKVTSISVSDQSDRFVTSASDNTVRVWDIQARHPLAVLRCASKCMGAIDPGGLVIAIALFEPSDQPCVKMYGVQNAEQGCFATFPLIVPEGARLGDWTGVKFSADGKKLLLSTSTGLAFLLDSFQGTLLGCHQMYTPNGEDIEVSLSPCGRYLGSGSPEGPLRMLNVESTEPPRVLPGHHDTTTLLTFNPRYAMFASACQRLAFWIPPSA